MTEKGYISDMYKQLEELMKKCDSLSHNIQEIKKEHKKEIIELKKLHQKEICKLNDQIRILQVENLKLTEENIKLKNEIDRLKSQINKDSNNSSNPPSTDIKPNKKDIPNNREKSSKKVGGQKGHKGTTLSKKEIEEKIKSNEFKHKIKHIGKVSDKYTSKYILDICVEVIATEYRFYANEKGKIIIPKEFKTDVQYGPEIKTLCTTLNVNDVIAIDRLTDFVSSISHGKINISNGTIINMIRTLSNKSETLLEKIETNTLNSKILYTDATSGRCDNRNVSIRNYSTEEYTTLKATKTKSKKSLEETGILPKYMGTLIHDHETVMYNFGTDHVECNVHVTRYLKGCYENTQNNWAKNMISFLCGLNNHKKEMIEKGINEIEKEKLNNYSERYDEIINIGYEENKKTKSKYYRQEEKKLLNRLKKYKENHMKFILDFDMPFDNNLSERDLRHVKMKQKISGTFKSMESLQNYLNIKSIIITCKKKCIDYYNLIRDLFNNKPVTI